MNSRWLFLVLLAVLFATGAYAEGTYQRTKDRKTLVWNSDPRPGDSATWSGARDEHGYATGYGTLTWFTAKQSTLTGSNIPSAKYIVFGRYSGNMIRGKLDGPVILNVKGQTFHAAFADGQRDNDWYAGPASAPADDHRNNARVVERETVAQPKAPAEGPPPVTRREDNQYASAPAVRERSGAPMDDSLRSLVSPPSLLRMNARAEPSPQISIPPAPPPSALATPLTAPTIPPTAAAAPLAGPRLTAEEATDLANAEMGRQGYNLREYQHTDARYTPADDTWSVLYDQERVDRNGMAETGRHFSVSVEDKTKKTAITTGR